MQIIQTAAMKRSGKAVGGSALSGFVVIFHSDDYIPLLVPCFDIPVSLGHLVQRIAPIDDRFDLSRLDKLADEGKILCLSARRSQTRGRK